MRNQKKRKISLHRKKTQISLNTFRQDKAIISANKNHSQVTPTLLTFVPPTREAYTISSIETTTKNHTHNIDSL